FVAEVEGLGVALRPSRVHQHAHAGVDEHRRTVGEGEERVARRDRPARARARLGDRDSARADAVHLPRARAAQPHPPTTTPPPTPFPPPFPPPPPRPPLSAPSAPPITIALLARCLTITHTAAASLSVRASGAGPAAWVHAPTSGRAASRSCASNPPGIDRVTS